MKKSYIEYFIADNFPTLNKKDPVCRVSNIVINSPKIRKLLGIFVSNYWQISTTNGTKALMKNKIK